MAVWTLAAVTFAAALRSFPPASEPPLDLSLFTLPQLDKLLAICGSLAAVALLNGAALSLGRLPRRFFAPEIDPRSAFVVDLALGFLLLGDGILLLAVFGLTEPAVFVVLLALPALLGVRESWRTLGSLCDPGRGLLRFTWAIFLFFFLFIGILDAFVPDFGWDAFVYHLAVPERILFTDGLWATPLSFYSAFPHAVQMLYVPFLAWDGLAFDGASAAQILHLEFGLLTTLILALSARRISRRAAAFTLLLLAGDPLFAWVTGTAYADLAGCLYAALAVWAVTRRDVTRKSLILAGIFTGAAFTVHYRLALFAVALGVVVLYRSARHQRRQISDFLWLTMAALLVASPWLIRNVVLFGNPVAPAAQSLFHNPGEEAFDPIAVEQSVHLAEHRGPGRDPVQFAFLPWRLFTGTYTDGSALYMFQVGSVYLLAALAWFFLRPSPKQDREAEDHVMGNTFAMVALLGTVLWFWSGAQESRYLLPCLVLWTVPGGIALNRAWEKAPRMRFLWILLLLGIIAAAHSKHIRHLPWKWGYAIGDLSVETFQKQEPALVAGETLRKTFREGDRLLLLFEGRAWFFRGLDYVPYHVNEGAPVLQIVRRSRDPADLERRLRELGITHVLLNPHSLRKYRTVFVDQYSQADFETDLEKIKNFLELSTTPYLDDRGVIVRRLRALEE